MKRVLVVEDNENNLHLFRTILQKSVFKVIEARDGGAGIEFSLRNCRVVQNTLDFSRRIHPFPVKCIRGEIS